MLVRLLALVLVGAMQIIMCIGCRQEEIKQQPIIKNVKEQIQEIQTEDMAEKDIKEIYEKVWPEEPLRGINTPGIFKDDGGVAETGGYLTREDFKRFAEWKVNLLRIAIKVDKGSIWDVSDKKRLPPIPKDDPMAPYREHLESFKVALQLADEFNMYIIPVASDVVGRNVDVLYNESDGGGYYETLVELWRHIIKNFGSNPRLLAYDILNEPRPGDELKIWQKKMIPELVKEIRTLDQNTYLVIEPGPWGLPNGFATLKPIDDPKVVYSFHFYMPHNYTHQGVKGRSGELVYPGKLKQFDNSEELYWDREQFKLGVKVAKDFQKRYNIRMWVGEFGVARWAAGSAKWIEDAISVFEEYRWDWCFHSYGGWNGWNPTFDAQDTATYTIYGNKITDRLSALLKGWRNNSK